MASYGEFALHFVLLSSIRLLPDGIRQNGTSRYSNHTILLKLGGYISSKPQYSVLARLRELPVWVNAAFQKDNSWNISGTKD